MRLSLRNLLTATQSSFHFSPSASATSLIIMKLALCFHLSIFCGRSVWTPLRACTVSNPSPPLRKETALSPAARLLGIDALTCGCNNSALTAIKIDFEGHASPKRRGFSQEHALSCALIQAIGGLRLPRRTRLCVAFVRLSSACWAISLWIRIPLPVTAGESCQNKCPSSCCGSQVHLVWREQLKESHFELPLRPVSTAVVADHRTGRLRKTAWRQSATGSPFSPTADTSRFLNPKILPPVLKSIYDPSANTLVFLFCVYFFLCSVILMELLLQISSFLLSYSLCLNVPLLFFNIMPYGKHRDPPLVSIVL